MSEYYQANDVCRHLVSGGLISFDVFPEGWDKTLCLEVLESEGLEAIYFFGNETSDVSLSWEIFQGELNKG